MFKLQPAKTNRISHINKLPKNTDNPPLEEEKLSTIKLEISKYEANLKTLSQNSAINRTIDIITDLKREYNILSGDSKELLIDDTEDRMDVFELITLNAKQVATKRSNSLIVTGHSGVGKTMTVIQAVAFLNPHPIIDTVIKISPENEPEEEIKIDIPKIKPISLSSFVVKKSPKFKVLAPRVESRNNSESGYYIAEGGCSCAAFYELLFLHRKKLLIFNDFDSILKDPDCVNLLKSALDTYPIRELSRMTKGNTFNSFGMSDAEMEEKYDLEGKLPNQFRFSGSIIFISNIHEEKIDKAIISRSLHVEVKLNRLQVLDRMLKILPDIRPEILMEYKLEALNWLDFLTSNYKTKFPLELRQLIHTIDNRAEYPPENPEYVKIAKNGNKLLVWQQMAKERLVERIFKY